jgi:homoserine O-acetyltransferase
VIIDREPLRVVAGGRGAQDADLVGGDIGQVRLRNRGYQLERIGAAASTIRRSAAAMATARAQRAIQGRQVRSSPIDADANDFLWQWGSSFDYDPAPGLEKIEAWVLAVNSADDERNPPETGIMVEAIKRVKNGKLYLIPASDQTNGHLTTSNARFYKQQLQEFLETVPPRSVAGGSDGGARGAAP